MRGNFRNAVYRLKADFDFEAQGDKWRLKAGYEFDGASVPTRAWDLTYEPGSVFVLEAAAKHDIFCEETPEGTDSEVAADDFKADVIRCGGTEEKGEMMRWAIVAFGPKWGPTLDNYLDGTNLPDRKDLTESYALLDSWTSVLIDVRQILFRALKYQAQ